MLKPQNMRLLVQVQVHNNLIDEPDHSLACKASDKIQ